MGGGASAVGALVSFYLHSDLATVYEIFGQGLQYPLQRRKLTEAFEIEYQAVRVWKIRNQRWGWQVMQGGNRQNWQFIFKRFRLQWINFLKGLPSDCSFESENCQGYNRKLTSIHFSTQKKLRRKRKTQFSSFLFIVVFKAMSSGLDAEENFLYLLRCLNEAQ